MTTRVAAAVYQKTGQFIKPDSKRCAEPIPEVHDLMSEQDRGATFPAIESKKMGVAIGVNHSVQKMRVVFQLKMEPVFHIQIIIIHRNTTLFPSYYEMVPLSTHRMPTPPYQPTKCKNKK
jgi:hypothetical protein